jgi:signal transduction histidine kinase
MPPVRALARTALRAPFTRRAWAELAYCLLGFPLAVAGFVPLVLLLALGGGLLVSLIGAAIGVLLVAAALALARLLCRGHRALSGALLGLRVPAPPPVRRGSGVLGRLDARLRDGPGWRCAAYALAKLPVAALGAYALGWWFSGLFNLTAPLRQLRTGSREAVPALTPLPFGGSPQLTTFAGSFLALAIGAGTLLLAPWLTRAAVSADRWLLRALLSPGELAERIRDLEETRALAVDDSVALLRRVERDLHDGAQVRLVALAMSLDMVKERLGPEGDPGTRRLVDTAHRNATEAIAELRDLARGIHPPVLDDGLPDALATLAARSSVPVELTVDMPMRPTPAIETIAYFCAAELLTNVIKHSAANRAALAVASGGGVLRLRVSDDGTGGARTGAGSGLTGLRQRVRTVDGRLDLDSPAGGPTVVTVELPLRA